MSGVGYTTNGTYEVLAPAPNGSDDTAVLQALIDALPAADSYVIRLREGTYTLTTDLVIATSGVAIVGAGRFRTIVEQVTAAESGITISRDETNTFTKGLRFQDFTLQGPGDGTSTGKGIDGSAAPSSTYNGQHIDFERVSVIGWATGVDLNRWDNLTAKLLHLEDCGVGWYHYGNANSVHIQVSATDCSTTAIKCGDAASCVIDALDLINSTQMITLDTTSARVVVLGGNFEKCNGATAFVSVPTSAYLTMISPKFLRGTGGADVPGVSTDLACVTLINPSYSGFTSNKVVRKTTTSAIVHLIGPSNTLSGSPLLIDDVGSVAAPGTPFPTRFDNSVPAASANLRGMLVYETVRDATTDADHLHWYGKDRRSASDVYTRRTLTSVITGTGTPEGAVTAGIGTLFCREDGGASTTLYVKESGTGNTGWVAK